MSGVPARAAGVAAWVTVVALGAVLVWVVISRAGNGLVADAGPVTTSTTASATGDGPSATGPGTLRRGSWQGRSGVVTATCQAGVIALVGAQPEDGVVVRVKEQGPDQLVVTFDDDGGFITVVGSCRDGRPKLTATTGASADSTSDTSPAGPSDEATSEGGDDRGSGHGSGDGASGSSGDD